MTYAVVERMDKEEREVFRAETDAEAFAFVNSAYTEHECEVYDVWVVKLADDPEEKIYYRTIWNQ